MQAAQTFLARFPLSRTVSAKHEKKYSRIPENAYFQRLEGDFAKIREFANPLPTDALLACVLRGKNASRP
jgi:hypothetical protein